MKRTIYADCKRKEMMDEVVPGLFSDVKYYIVGEIDDKVSIEIPKVNNVKMRT